MSPEPDTEPEPAAFILDCSPLVLVRLIETTDDDEDSEESEQA